MNKQMVQILDFDPKKISMDLDMEIQLIFIGISVVTIVIFFLSVYIAQKYPSLRFLSLFNREEYESQKELFHFSKDFSNLDVAQSIGDALDPQFSNLKIGPFDAEIARELIEKPVHLDETKSFIVATNFFLKIHSIQNFSFQINFQGLSNKISQESFYETINMNVADQGLKDFFQSEEFLEGVFFLSSISPGIIKCFDDVFSITLFKSLSDEETLNEFIFSCNFVFRKYAQFLQLNAMEWRRNAIHYDWWSQEASIQERRIPSSST